MAKLKRNPLSRQSQTREYRKVFWVNTEGWTEYDYLKMDVFSSLSNATVRMPKKKHPGRTNPPQVLKELQEMIRKGMFRKNDEAWVVIDVDTWDEGEIEEVLKWVKKDSRFHTAISNPKFELFLVMHFEKGNGCTTSEAVDSRLRRYIPKYNKRIARRQFTVKEINQAIQHAAVKRLSCQNIVPEARMTDVHELIRRVMDHTNN